MFSNGLLIELKWANHRLAQSAVIFWIVFKLLDDYMLSPTENHLKMIDANVFVLACFPL